MMFTGRAPERPADNLDLGSVSVIVPADVSGECTLDGPTFSRRGQGGLKVSRDIVVRCLRQKVI